MQFAWTLDQDPFLAAAIDRLQQQPASTERDEQLAHLCRQHAASRRAGGAAAVAGHPHLDAPALGSALLDLVLPALGSLFGQTRHDAEPQGGTHRAVAAAAAALRCLEPDRSATASLARGGGDEAVLRLELSYAVAHGFCRHLDLAFSLGEQASRNHPGGARLRTGWGAGGGWARGCVHSLAGSALAGRPGQHRRPGPHTAPYCLLAQPALQPPHAAP